MERDKRGRFVKKALGGTQLNSDGIITSEGKKYKLKPNLQMSQVQQLLEKNKNNIDAYNHYLTQYFDPVEETSSAGVVTPSTTLETPKDETTSIVTPDTTSVQSSQVGGINTGIKYKKLNTGLSTSLNTPGSKLYSTKAMMSTIPTSLNFNFGDVNARKKALEASVRFGLQDSMFAPEKIKYTIKNGKFIDEFGNNISSNDIAKENSIYTRDFQANEGTGVTTETKVRSKGMNLFPETTKNKTQKNFGSTINKERLANFLELARAGIGASVNKKIAERALEAEKPFLQDVSESHRAVYGDYRSQLQGEKTAAQLRNMVSKPLTSDGALQQQMMMDAQIKGQQYIDQGNAQDEALIKQTREIAWQQEKENQQQRQAAAMQNRQAMLMSQKNKAQIENARDSANFSQVLFPLLSGAEQRLRNKSKEQEYYQQQYDNAMVYKDVWNTYTTGLSPEQKEMVKIFNTSGDTGIQTYINGDQNKESTWLSLKNIMQNEILRRHAALKGVHINPSLYLESSNPYSMWDEGLQFDKKGGIIYKARLTKRTKDNDRAVKSIESSKKIAARFLEKAIDSLYTYNDVELIAKSENKRKRKYQAGGGLPFVGFSPVFATSETGTSRATAKETKGEDITTKDIIELLKDIDGLPSDIDAIQEALSDFILADQMDPLKLDSSSNIAARYMKVLGLIKKAKANRDWYDKAYDKLRNDGSLNEYVIDSTGHFIGMNSDGDFARFSAKQVASEQTGEYTLLTNSNLLDIRARYPNAAFNSNLIMEAANGISMQQINDHINNVIQGLGSDKSESQIFGDQSKDVLAGLKQLQQAAQQVGQDLSISELYEANVFTESQAQQAQLALNYLYQTLPTNMQALLFSKTGSIEGVRNLINSLVSSKLSSTTKLEFSPKNTRKASTSSKTGNVVLDGLDLSPAQMLQQGFGERQTIVIQDATSSGLKVEAITMPITKDGNNPLGSATLEDISTSQYGGVLDFTNASMGGKIVPFEGRRNVAVDGSKIYSMYLPIDQNELAKNNIVPDLTLIDKVNTVNKTIKNKGITDPKEINELYTQAGLPVYMNDNGTVIPTFYRRFGILNGTAIDNAFGSDFVANRYLKEIEDEDVINSAISIMNQGRSKEDKIEYDAKSFFNFGGLLGDYDSVYQGTVFIPISNDVFLGIAGSGQTITSTEANALEAKQQQHQRVSATYKNPGQLR